MARNSNNVDYYSSFNERAWSELEVEEFTPTAVTPPLQSSMGVLSCIDFIGIEIPEATRNSQIIQVFFPDMIPSLQYPAAS